MASRSGKFVVSSMVLAMALIAFTSTGEAQSLTNQTDNGAPISVASPFQGGCPFTIDGTLGSGSPNYTGTSGDQTGRLNRNGIASTCAVPKVCDIFATDPGRAYDAYEFQNTSGGTSCVSATLEVITQTACNLQLNMYSNTYNPLDICEGYIADPGFSSGTPPSLLGPFEGDIPAGDSVIFVVHTTNPGEFGCEYLIHVDGDCFPVELESLEIE